MANTTFNPSDKGAAITLSGGNLIVTVSTGAVCGVRAVDRQVSGKFYWEVTCTSMSAGAPHVGVARSTTDLSNNAAGYPSSASISSGYGVCGVRSSGSVYLDGTQIAGIALGTLTAGTVVCVALDCTARLIWFRAGAAGNWNGSVGASPATGVGGACINSLGVGIPLHPAVWAATATDQYTANFGDTAFVGAVPSGYTSGFTAGASVPTNALASQTLAEHWLTTNPDARITQVVLEHWASVSTGNLQAIVTQVVLEHWMSVAQPATGGPIISMIH